MKANPLKHKGHEGIVTWVDPDENRIHGEVVGLRDVITFEGSTPAELKAAFRDSVEDYLAWCASSGQAAERPFSGQLSLRLKPELHRRLAIAAQREGCSLNAYLVARLSEGLGP